MCKWRSLRPLAATKPKSLPRLAQHCTALPTCCNQNKRNASRYRRRAVSFFAEPIRQRNCLHCAKKSDSERIGTIIVAEFNTMSFYLCYFCYNGGNVVFGKLSLCSFDWGALNGFRVVSSFTDWPFICAFVVSVLAASTPAECILS